MDLKINLKQFAPKHTYMRNGAKCYLDPYRQMLVPVTPESLLQLKMEMYVNQVMGVPKNMMYMNQSFRKYGVDSSKQIDIVIHDTIDGEIKPVAIVECKAPDMALYHTTIAHIEGFAKKIGVNYLIVTNGTDVDSYISREDRLSFWKIDNVPDYETICNGHRAVLADEFAAQGVEAKVKKPAPKPQPSAKFNSKTTPKAIQPAVMSLVKGLRDDHSRFKHQAFGHITVLGDCGLRKKLTGFGSEKQSKTLQRTLLIKDFYGNHQLISFDLTPDLHGAPILSVTLDDYDSRQVVFTLDLNLCLSESEQGFDLCCDLDQLFSKEEERFVPELCQLIEKRMPQLKFDRQMAFGNLMLLEPFKLDQEESAQLLANLAAFALVVDEYREQLKSETKDFKKRDSAKK